MPDPAPSDTPTEGVRDGSLDDTFARELRGSSPPVGLALQLGDVIDHKYRLVRVLGRGGMGIVYEAEHVDAPDLHFAIKTILPADVEKFAEHFVREARSIAKIRHENVIKISDVGRTLSGVPFMVMEYLDSDLSRYVQEQGGTVSPREAVELCLQVCLALAAAHDKKIAHRDIKPGNCLVQRQENRVRVIVSDFGLAKVLHGDDSKHSEWTAAGSRGYIAPEVYSGTPRPDHRVDIYGVGAMLFALIIGETPAIGVFDSGEFHRDPKLRGAIPAVLVPVLQRSLALRPADRFENARSLADTLRLVLEELATASRPGFRRSDTPPTNPRPHRHLIPLVGVTLLSLAGAAWTVWSLLGPGDREPPPVSAPTKVEPPTPKDPAPPSSPPSDPAPPPPPDPEPKLPDPPPPPETKPKPKIRARDLLKETCEEVQAQCKGVSELKATKLFKNSPLRATLSWNAKTRKFTDYGLLGEDKPFKRCLDAALARRLKDKLLTDAEPSLKCTITL